MRHHRDARFACRACPLPASDHALVASRACPRLPALHRWYAGALEGRADIARWAPSLGKALGHGPVAAAARAFGHMLKVSSRNA